MITSLAKGLGQLAGWLRIGGQLVLLFMVVTVCYETVMRYLFAAPTVWSLEINSFLMVYLAVMTAADVQHDNAHIRIGFIVERLPMIGQRAVTVLIGLVGVVFCAVLTWRGWLLASEAFQYGERVSSALGTPMAIPYAMLPVGFGCLTLQFAIQALLAIVQPPQDALHSQA